MLNILEGETKMITEIRIMGRGGQGAILASYLISVATFREGMFSRSFGMFGVERRGAPVTSFVVIGRKEEMTRCRVYAPDHVIVLDPYLLRFEKATEGLKENGTVTVNTTKSPREILSYLKLEDKNVKIGVVDAMSISQKVLGAPIPNTAMLGAFVQVTGIVSLESILDAIKQRFSGASLESNIKAAQMGYETVRAEMFIRGR